MITTTIYIVHNTIIHNIGGNDSDTSGMIKNNILHGNNRTNHSSGHKLTTMKVADIILDFKGDFTQCEFCIFLFGNE